jgi:hypothetical protein
MTEIPPRDDGPPTVPPPPDSGDPREAADAAFFRSVVELGQRHASEKAAPAPPPRRRVRRRFGRTVLVAIGALLTLGGGAVATKVFVADDGSVPIEREPGKGVGQAPDNSRTATARAKDPKNANVWSVRVYYNDRGQTCVLVGVLANGRLGEIKDGKFKQYPAGTPGLCDALTDHILTTARSYVHTAEPRTVVYGVADRSIIALTLRTHDGRRHNVPIALDGSYVLPLTGTHPLAGGATLTARNTNRTTTTQDVKIQPPQQQLP